LRALELTSDLETGIADIDDQHRRLFACANAVFSLEGSSASEEVALRAARFLVAYTVYHFRAEEHAMVAMGFAELKRHREQHARLLAQVARVRQLVEDVAPFRTIVGVLHVLLDEWLKEHIGISDRAFARYCEGLGGQQRVTLPTPHEMHREGDLSTLDYRDVKLVHANHAKPLSAVQLRERMLR
jgi:hemerythrin